MKHIFSYAERSFHYGTNQNTQLTHKTGENESIMHSECHTT